MKSERYMTVLGGYKLDMQNHGHLVQKALPAVKDIGITLEIVNEKD